MGRRDGKTKEEEVVILRRSAVRGDLLCEIETDKVIYEFSRGF